MTAKEELIEIIRTLNTEHVQAAVKVFQEYSSTRQAEPQPLNQKAPTQNPPIPA